MKVLISLIIGLLLAWVVFFRLDPAIVGWIVNSLPASADEWKPFLKVVGWIVVFLLTGGITVALSIMLGGFVYVILKAIGR